ncbi:MAG TPA: TetR/AcrR family transcriptional regulator [Acidimicrobiales bacterium]|nr:TetR/AcrR family transcriptional regulator [Acidimicrobiales bacterium]
MPRPRTGRAEEILEHAMRLFAERGYEAVSVADIQAAAGMTPGSGALYKHFPSKQALLEAGIDRFIGQGRRAILELPEPAGDDLEPMLRGVGAAVLEALAEDRASLRVAWRDLPAFPELSRRFVDQRLQEGFTQLGRWLRELSERGMASVDDPEATASVLLGALAFFRLMESVFDETPGRVPDERVLDAWVAVAVGALGTRGA